MFDQRCSSSAKQLLTSSVLSPQFKPLAFLSHPSNKDVQQPVQPYSKIVYITPFYHLHASRLHKTERTDPLTKLPGQLKRVKGWLELRGI